MCFKDKGAFVEILACLSAATFHFSIGTVLGFSAILIPQLEAPNSDIKVDKHQISWIASVVALVMPLGALITGLIIDRIGRLNTIRAAVLPYMAGWLCIALARGYYMIIVGRFLTGLSCALGSNPAFVYISEVARPKFRGALVSVGPTMSSFGMVMIYLKGAFLDWRLVSWLSMGYCVLPLLCIALWSAESPVWLIAKGRNEDALQSLTFLSRGDKLEDAAKQKLEALLNAHDTKQAAAEQNTSMLMTLFRGLVMPNGFKAVMLITVIFIFQQFSGIYITIFYSVSIFMRLGATIDPYESTVFIGLVRLVMGLISSVLLKNFGRRLLLMISAAGMAVSMFISGYFTREVSEGNIEKSFIPAICTLLYMCLSVIGLMNIPWIMTAELFDTDIRGMAQSLMIAVADIILFSAIKIYPFLDEALGGPYAVEWMFAGVSLGALVFVYIFIPETHGKELSEIQENLKHHTIYILANMRKKKEKLITDETGEVMALEETAGKNVTVNV